MDHTTSMLGPQWLREVVGANRNGQAVGMFSVCSAHPVVLAAAMRQALDDGSMLSIESTSNQVNQFGGYTELTPRPFRESLLSLADQVCLPRERILLGGDHLGPYPWRDEPSEQALAKARTLVRDCVLAGYKKIHLDASMRCGDDRLPLDDDTIAQRAALLCAEAENAHRELPAHSPAPQYVIGTEVPVPGGEQSGDAGPQPTTTENAKRTLDSFRRAFFARGLHSAWERVIALVVQTGAEFGDQRIFDYDSRFAKSLAEHLPDSPSIVYEAHSTDYQQASALREMVRDHFAILKVGPWLTFAYREAIFALSSIEQDWLANKRGLRISCVRKALDAAMLRKPSYWQPYHSGANDSDDGFSRFYSYSDRCRYYWQDATVKEELAKLLCNLSAGPIPTPLISQYFPEQYDYVRVGKRSSSPESLIDQHIRNILRMYHQATHPQS